MVQLGYRRHGLTGLGYTRRFDPTRLGGALVLVRSSRRRDHAQNKGGSTCCPLDATRVGETHRCVSKFAFPDRGGEDPPVRADALQTNRRTGPFTG
jgi:hypothetical protein